ncbi:unnamed protein product [Vicia faba]|uniref:Uncharacterized protein n=1 Tax=Vicia faba TaxID=3906 RepID=A0AAV0Z5F2_VICFA|nr:unnamed protein product [Vicia faba]
MYMFEFERVGKWWYQTKRNEREHSESEEEIEKDYGSVSTVDTLEETIEKVKINKVTLDYSCSNAPGTAPEKERKANARCHWVDCGCEKFIISFISTACIE